MKPIYYIIPLLNFLLAALLGVLLRSLFIVPLEGVTFLYILHTHSHVALLGWLYLLVFVLFVQKFGIHSSSELLFYKRLFWCTQLSVIGMAVTFPFMGYALPSIFFSTAHIICSYIFVFHIWKHNTVPNLQVGLLLKTALFFMVFSTLGVWCLGPAVGMMGKASVFYQICIQFFLHFQFDGWFMTAFLALLFATVLRNHLLVRFKQFYLAWVCSVILTCALPLSWYVSLPYLYAINIVGVLLQLYVVGCLVKPIYSVFKHVKISDHNNVWYLLLLSTVCLILRVLIQLAVIFKEFAIELQALRIWIIAFIHLNMLGVLSGFGLWLFIQEKKVKLDTWIRCGIILLIWGFVLTEVILLLQGCQVFWGVVLIQRFPLGLFWASLLLPMSIGCFLVSYFKERKS